MATLVPEDTKLEAEIRQEIDAKLTAAGWAVQDKKKINLIEKLGVLVCEIDADKEHPSSLLLVAGIIGQQAAAYREPQSVEEVQAGTK